MTAEKAQAYPIGPELAQKIDHVLDAHDHDATQIVGVLLDVQVLIAEQDVLESVVVYVAQKLPIKVSIIYDCLTFYAALSDKPRAKFPIQICRSVVCKVNDSDSLLERLEKILNIGVGDVTYDGRFTIEEVPCFGACDIAPAVRINGKVYGHLNTDESVKELLAQFI